MIQNYIIFIWLLRLFGNYLSCSSLYLILRMLYVSKKFTILKYSLFHVGESCFDTVNTTS